MQFRSTMSRAVLTTFVCCALLNACVTTDRIPLAVVRPPGAASELKPGSMIIATLNDGSTLRFKLRAVEADALSGRSGERVSFADLTSLEVERTEVKAPLLTVLATAALLVVVIGGELLDSGDDDQGAAN